MTADDGPEALVRAFYSRLWEQGDRSAAPDILHPDLVFRGSVGLEKRGIDGFWEYLQLVRDALGDYRCDILSLVTDDRQAAAKMWFHGIHKGSFLGAPATERHIGWHGAAFFQLRDARLAEIWVLGDVDALRAALQSDT